MISLDNRISRQFIFEECTIKFPIIVISYDNFADNKKLLSYEVDGEYLLPIFTDLNHAKTFAQGMADTLHAVGDNRELVCQICKNPKHAIDMFTMIGLLSPQKPKIIVNPPKPNHHMGDIASQVSLLITQKKTIEEIIKEFQSLSEISKQE